MNKYIIFFIGLITMATTCVKQDTNCSANSHNSITFLNNSSKKLQFEIYWNYPDTVIGEYNPSTVNPVLLNQTQSRGAGRGSCWESIFLDLKQHKEWVYIFDQDSLQVIPWEIVRKTNRGLLERRVIDIDYLSKNNFTITYP